MIRYRLLLLRRMFLGLLMGWGLWIVYPPLSVYAQLTVSGRVTSAEDGQGLPGVNVVVSGTTVGTATDLDGRYVLVVPSPNDTLVFSFVGFETAVVPVAGRTVIHVELRPAVILGEEVVVIGYGTLRQREVGGAVTTVNAEELNPIATLSVNQMVQGKVPGLDLRVRTTQPGGGVSVNVRGAISPRGNNTPLYVIDGVPITEYRQSDPGLYDRDLGFYGGVDRDPLAFLNPSDIESITVLKDASAAAIYGSAAANGVVLITTKSGRAGAVRVDYRGSYTAQRMQDYFPLLNARQFMEEQRRLSYDRYLYENQLPPYGSRNPNSVPPYTPLFSDTDILNAGRGTDWIDLISENGQVIEHNIAVRGGSPNTQFYTSFNLQLNDAVLKNSNLNRYSLRLNVDQNLSSGVRLRLRTQATRLEGNNASTGANAGGPEKFNMIQNAMTFAPTVPIYDENGNFTKSYYRIQMNPAAFLIIDDDSRVTSLFAAPTLEVNLTDQLQLNVVGQYQEETTLRGFYLPRTADHDVLPEGMAQKSTNSVQNYSAESYLTYTGSVGPGVLTAVAGAGYYRGGTEGSFMQGVGFFTDAFGYNNIGVSSDKLRSIMNSWKSARTKLSQFARINYALQDRYVLTLVARRDGSSIFSENHKWGFFPGVSFAWLLSDEPFLRNVASLSQLKLRLSYGEAGNESVLSGNTLQLYTTGYPFVIGSTEYNGVAVSQVANPNLKWETVQTFNVGLDFGLWRYRVRGSLDVFVKTARDLLDFNPLPVNNPVGRLADNVGSTRSRGFELALHTENLSSSQLRWNTDLTLAYYKSYWVERNPRVPLPPYIGEHDPLDALYGWQTAGIIRKPEDRPAYMPNANLGNLIFVDQNNDGVLNEQDVVLLGNTTPRWQLGLNNTISLGNFDVNVFVYGYLGFKRYNNFAPSVDAISQVTTPMNTTIYARDIWSTTKPEGTRPGVAANPYATNNPTGNTDFDLHDASFLRLKSITLGYTIPSRWLGGVASSVRQARLFIDVQNLGVLTNYPGFDPEYTEPNPYPKYTSITVGLELGF
ncbi:SusC/RagA family TonB-linked outer membrane protein [Rhodothermus bifroesti]|uniref:SusC/RagA family TonB-linked outer membrane protein n=1 Tax=Rhodothermus bifroesti TaxID=2823335 RepID=UPI001AEF887C|nr:SusC/RagA family TonB-linked outer membrane protein [Rhodothermus bifroesti]